MGTVITRNRIHADDRDFVHLEFVEGKAREVGDWLRAHGFGLPESYVFQVEVDVVDCPLLRLWWLGREELHALPAEELGRLMDLVHVTEVAVAEPFPAWWQPEAVTAR